MDSERGKCLCIPSLLWWHEASMRQSSRQEKIIAWNKVLTLEVGENDHL